MNDEDEYKANAEYALKMADRFRADMNEAQRQITGWKRKRDQAEERYEAAILKAAEWNTLWANSVYGRSRVVLRVIQGGKCA